MDNFPLSPSEKTRIRKAAYHDIAFRARIFFVLASLISILATISIWWLGWLTTGIQGIITTLGLLITIMVLIFSTWWRWLKYEHNERIEQLEFATKQDSLSKSASGTPPTLDNPESSKNLRSTILPLKGSTSLSPPSPDFTGRTSQIRTLVKALHQGRPIVISGMGGIGKTDLARKVFTKIKSHFPGPAIQIELQPDNNPLLSIELLGILIRVLHPVGDLPDSLTERTAILQVLMQGQKGILLLDNALTHEQIKPLEPLWDGWAIMITLRADWVVAGGKVERLGPLGEHSAVNLVRALTNNYGRPVTKDHAEQISEGCRYHPLALHIASAYLGTNRQYSIEEYLKRVYATPVGALDTVGYDNLAKVLGESVTRLQEGNAVFSQCWHILAMMPDTFDASMAAAMLGQFVKGQPPHITPLEAGVTQQTLDGLLKLNLLEITSKNGVTLYSFHNFLMDYALHHSPYRVGSNVRHLAVRRHALSVLERGRELNSLYQKGQEISALAQFDALWTHLKAAWEKLKHEADAIALYFVDSFASQMANLLTMRLSPRDRLSYFQISIDAAREGGNHFGEVTHLVNLGNAYRHLGEPRNALDYYNKALEIVRSKGYKEAEGICLDELGVTYKHLGEAQKSIDYHEQALSISRQIANRQREGMNLANLGSVFLQLREHTTAMGYCQQALAIAREIGDARGEGNRLGNLGRVYRQQGNFDTAIIYHKKAHAIAVEIGDARGEGKQLGNLGKAYLGKKDTISAIDYAQQALSLIRKNGDRRGEGIQLWTLARAYYLKGEIELAKVCGVQALQIHKETEHPDTQEIHDKLREWDLTQ